MSDQKFRIFVIGGLFLLGVCVALACDKSKETTPSTVGVNTGEIQFYR